MFNIYFSSLHTHLSSSSMCHTRASMRFDWLMCMCSPALRCWCMCGGKALIKINTWSKNRAYSRMCTSCNISNFTSSLACMYEQILCGWIEEVYSWKPQNRAMYMYIQFKSTGAQMKHILASILSKLIVNEPQSILQNLMQLWCDLICKLASLLHN